MAKSSYLVMANDRHKVMLCRAIAPDHRGYTVIENNKIVVCVHSILSSTATLQFAADVETLRQQQRGLNCVNGPVFTVRHMT